MADIDEAAVIAGCTREGGELAVGRLLGRQDDVSLLCHMPEEGCILRSAIDLQRLVELVVEDGEGDVASVVFLGVHDEQGTVEGLAVLRSVLVGELLGPQAHEAFFHSLLGGACGGLVLV